jgi:hypothetical protein
MRVYRTPYKRRQLLGAWAPYSLDAVKEVLGGHLQDEVRENLKTPSEVLGRLQYSATKSSEACQIWVHGTVHVAYFSRISVGTWPMLYICVTTRSLVELLLQ